MPRGWRPFPLISERPTKDYVRKWKIQMVKLESRFRFEAVENEDFSLQDLSSIGIKRCRVATADRPK